MDNDIIPNFAVAMSRIPYISTAFILTLSLFVGGCASKKHNEIYNDPLSGETEYILRTDRSKLDAIRKKIVAEALTWKGTPYKYGGNEKGIGTDCSGLVLRVYNDVASIKLPRNSRRQAEFCLKVNQNEIKGGDLVFFATGKDPETVSHVGLMIDKERFIHASGSKGVIVSELTTPYYRRTFLMFGRVPAK